VDGGTVLVAEGVQWKRGNDSLTLNFQG
jgi:hypothetical protein